VTTHQTPQIQAAWKALASKKELKTGKLSQSNPENSLYEAYQAGWLVFKH
jgi:hypothetical protein